MDVKRDYTPTVYINCINPIIHQLNIMLHIIQLTIEFTKLCASTWRDSVIRGLTVWWWDPWEPSPATAGNWCYTAWCGSNKHDDLVNLKIEKPVLWWTEIDISHHITSYHISMFCVILFHWYGICWYISWYFHILFPSQCFVDMILSGHLPNGFSKLHHRHRPPRSVAKRSAFAGRIDHG